MKKTGDNFSGNQLTGKSHSLLLACCSLLFLRFSMNSFRLFGFPMDPNRVFRFFPSTPVADFSVFHMDPNRGFFQFFPWALFADFSVFHMDPNRGFFDFPMVPIRGCF